jgi:large repetitive protein
VFLTKWPQEYARPVFLYLLPLIALIFAASSHAAYVNRYSNIANGAITFTGNTLGLNKANNANTPGTVGSIGTFITTNTAVRDNTYPFGTTATFANNSSQAVLAIPPGSTVLYAELVWGGSSNLGGENVTASLGNSVTFITPAGTSAVAPAAATAQFDPGASAATRYVRSANVTALVQAAGAGTYTVGGVPATQGNNENNGNTAGWTLAVVYSNPALPARSLSLFVGAEAGGAAPAQVTGFCTPPTGPLSGRLLVSAMEGDSALTGDQMRFGQTAAGVVALSGSNNPVGNFFASQINNNSGALDTTGTFGGANQTPGTGAIGRQGYDITNVDASATLANNQTSAFAQGTTSGDQYSINALGIQINVGSPIFPTGVKTVDKAIAKVGDILTYTVLLSNTAGTANADNVFFTDTVPPGTSFVTGSFRIDGVVQALANPAAGVNVGTIASGASKTVSFQALVNTIPSAPATALYSNSATWSYQFISCAGQPVTNASLTTNPVLTSIARLAITKNVAPAGAVRVGQFLTYSISVNNDGTANSSGSTLIDAIPAGTTYVPGSTTFNGAVVADASGAMPFTVTNAINSPGQPAGQINVGATATVTFQVQVNTGPGGNTITNTANGDVDGPGGAASVSASVNSPVSPTVAPPITKVFSPTSIAPGANSTITFTLGNTNLVPLTNVNFTDALTNMSVSSATIGGTCAGVTNSPALVADITALNLTIPSLPVGGCTITVQVTSSTAGTHPNSTSGVTSTQTPTAGAASNVATLQVLSLPTIAKAFGASPIAEGGTSTITFTLTNPNTAPLTNANFTDALTSISVSSATIGGTCAGTTNSPALVVGATALNLTVPSLPTTGCTVTVQVTSSTVGTNPNTASGVTSTQTPIAGPPSNTANLTVMAPPIVTKTFLTNPVAKDAITKLSIAIRNPNTIAITGAAFTDNYPTTPNNNLVNSNPTNAAFTAASITAGCTGTITAAAGARSLALTGGTIPPNTTCTITVDVLSTSNAQPTYLNNTGPVTTTNAGTGAAASDSLVVVNGPTVSKSFTPASIPVGGISQLTVNLSTTAGGAGTTGVAITDTYPAGLVNAPGTPIVSNTCGGSLTAAPGANTISLSGGLIPPNSSCSFIVQVTAATAGVYTNIIPIGAVTSSSGSNILGDTANLTVLAPMSVSKAFVPSTINAGTVSNLIITLNNPNIAIATLSSNLIDTLPAGMTVAATPNIGGTCNPAFKIAAPGGGTVSYEIGGTIPANGSCTISVDVTSVAGGTANNLIPAGALQTNNGNSAAAANAILTINPVADLSITKTDLVAAYTPGTTATYTLTVANAGPSNVTGAVVADNLPLGVTLSGPWSCTASAGSSCSAASGGAAGGNAVNLTVNLLATGTATITVPVNFSSNPANY